MKIKQYVNVILSEAKNLYKGEILCQKEDLESKTICKCHSERSEESI